jgi:hypothetical protein
MVTLPGPGVHGADCHSCRALTPDFAIRLFRASPCPSCGCRKPVHLTRPGHTRGPARRGDRAVQPVRWPLEQAQGRLPAVAPGRESGAACVRCSARRSLPAPSRDVADPRSASGPAAHAGLSPPIAQPPRSRVVPSRASAKVRMPSEAKMPSKLSVNFASRSRTRNLNCPMRSFRSMSRLRACWATTPRSGSPSRPRRGRGGWQARSRTAQTPEQDRVDVEVDVE